MITDHMRLGEHNSVLHFLNYASHINIYVFKKLELLAGRNSGSQSWLSEDGKAGSLDSLDFLHDL